MFLSNSACLSHEMLINSSFLPTENNKIVLLPTINIELCKCSGRHITHRRFDKVTNLIELCAYPVKTKNLGSNEHYFMHYVWKRTSVCMGKV